MTALPRYRVTATLLTGCTTPAHVMHRPDQIHHGHRRRVRASSALAAISCAVTIAACGSSANSSTTTGSAGTGQGVAFADCMRSHGVAGFPDPGPGGGVAIPSTINPQSPSYRAALQNCAKLQPGAIGGPPNASEHARIVDVEFSKCMRRRGILDFPDPSLSVLPPSQAHGIVRGGMYWPLPAGSQQSPAFQKAAEACGLGRPHVSAAAG